MKDWLPILIGVIWVALTLYNKGKKKNPSTAHPSGSNRTQNKSPSLFEQILSGQLGQEENIYTEPEKDSIESDFLFEETEKQNIEEAQPFLTNELSQFSQEGQAVEFEIDTNNDNNLTFDAEDIVKSDFDLKKAVVYSAILNAPYIDFK